jgi:hypothetical protein
MLSPVDMHEDRRVLVSRKQNGMVSTEKRKILPPK